MADLDDETTDNEESQQVKTYEESVDEINGLKQMLNQLKLNTLSLDDSGIDDIRTNAMSAYKDMLDAGFNADSKYAANFLEPAVAALNIAMETEKTKLKKKLEYYRLKQQDDKLELLRRKIELEEKRAGQSAEIVDEDSVLMNRNELLKNLLNDK